MNPRLGGRNVATGTTADQRAAALVSRWCRADPGLGRRTLVDLRTGIANEIEAAEEQRTTYLHTRNRTLHARLECAVAAIKELRLKQAVRQSVEKDWYRNVAGRGVRLGLAALKEYARDRSEQIRHETRAKNRPHVESDTRNHLDTEKPE